MSQKFTTQIMSTGDSTIEELREKYQKYRYSADGARNSLEAATHQLIKIIAMRCDTSYKVARIVWSCWNGEHLVGLCDALCGLDSKCAPAVLSLIQARIILGGEADDLIHKILADSGEFERFDRVAERTPRGATVPYPLPLACPDRLRLLADAIEAARE